MRSQTNLLVPLMVRSCMRESQRLSGCTSKQLLTVSDKNYDSVRPMGILGFSKPSEWNKVVSDAERIVGYPTSFLSLRCLLSDELSNVALQMRKLVGTRHPLLQTAKDMIHDGKHGLQTRGLIVLLLSKAAGPAPGMDVTEHDMVSGIFPSQRSLAEITEIVHTANLIHKGVVNMADLMPADGAPGDMEFGNKMAVLSGDFLLASACTGLADLGNTEVVELIAGAIGDLMEAEFTGFTDKHGNPTLPASVTFSDWLRQIYLQSGSLLARSCQAAMKLASHSTEAQHDAYNYGLNTAYVQQLSDDLAAITKGEYSDIRMTAAPIIMLQEEKPDTAQALLHQDKLNMKQIVSELHSSGLVVECRKLCDDYSTKAVSALTSLRPSDAKTALINMVHAIRRI
ncbi:all trans-polyprenyl-diphosphate synthase PDSS2-like [Littorina saxatilis]|uniref:Decaprenyl-diphosphate synthase subunit 2 n=1 Tax=Littorina saxatilis TaxID=31220 RepID=A0AAN9BLU4_9CAEN